MVAGGVAGARRTDAFELLLTKMADVLKEAKTLTEQDAYPTVSGVRDQFVAHLAQPEHEAPLVPVLDHWYDSEECKTLIRYRAQYEARADAIPVRTAGAVHATHRGPALRAICAPRGSATATAPSSARSQSFGDGRTAPAFRHCGKESRQPARQSEDQSSM